MKLRTIARVAAMKYLYELEMSEGLGCEDPSEYMDRAGIPRSYADYSLRLIRGVLGLRDSIDASIREAASNWPLGRMAAIDRNLLRMAAFEIQSCEDVPPRVVINEAVDLAKKYSTAKSGAFVNGVLDKIYENTRRAGDVRVHQEGPPEDGEDTDV